MEKEREIKFRMWSTASKKMSPSLPLKMLLEFVGKDPLKHLEQVIPMQFSGMKDVYGKEIYEEDICKQVVDGKTYIGKMIFSPERFQFGLEAFVPESSGLGPYHPIKLNRGSTDGLPEVIGNIYENPELVAKTHN